ncbi:unnamed protein product [Cyprideis torosa]|uniref:Uncharacterized protein n=1 Tax=Cyprideis torosa TaxID=163714 RepID=A0A7R8WNX4_9CRUS|nr:unnamed protein product [Cyprideis torosa]CAG0906730.1 unnamed protein product [Cyprideis torosa]
MPESLFGFSVLRKHSPLVPLVVFISVGVSMGTIALLRAALKNPDVNWTRKGLAGSNEDYRDKQYKVITLSTSEIHLFRYNTETPVSKAPKYDE